MARLNLLLRDGIKTLVPYSSKTPKHKIKLDIMENPYPIPEAVKNKIKKAIDKIALNRYPDPEAEKLRLSISRYVGLPSDMILVGNGSDELILYILLAFSGKVIFPTPTFPMYEIIGKVASCETIGIPLISSFGLDCGRIIDEAKKSKSIIFIAYPNNPTGNCFDEKEIERIIEETDSIVIIDEAYYEFSKKSFVGLLPSYNRLAILRTFSKAFGLAGLRCGYILANKEFIGCIEKVKLPYNLNIISQEIVAICLEEKDSFEKIIEKIIAERERLSQELLKIEEIKVFPSSANFLFFKVEKPGIVYSLLLKEGILVKQVADGLRITTGTSDENKAFIEAMKRILNHSV
ncbi:TPA: histidinol-phosphate transaminase [bacterium]|nr:histidinol-phosphate transaminase [bacterium]